MMSRCLLVVLAAVASAQQQNTADTYAITDMISHDQGAAVGNALGGGVVAPSNPSPPITQPYQQLARPAAPVSGPVPNAGPVAGPVPNAGPVPGTAGQAPQTGLNPVNPMATLLKGMMGGGGGAMSPATPSTNLNSRQGLQSLGQESTQVVSGLVEAFMHKIQLEQGERKCLETNMGQLTGDVMGTVGDIVIAIKALVKGNGKVAQSQAGGLVSAGIDSAMKITSLITMATSLMKNCAHGDALILMKQCGQHMTNGTYLEHEFLVNGIDIAHALSDSIIAFENKDFHKFGHDIGLSLRKILLSKNTKQVRLPEGVPDEVIVQKTMAGLFDGFFVRGSGMEITDTAHPDIDIRVDLHQCIAGNEAFFKELWMAAWDLIAQLSMNAEQHGLGNTARALQAQQGGQPKWQGELMIAMMQVPMALQKCGVSGDMESMFMEAIKTLNDIQVHVKMPNDQVRAEDAAKKMALAVEAWTKWDFEKFGFELGELFRELIMLAFPQKYSVDAFGRLQRLSEESGSSSGSLVIVAGAAMSVLFAFAVIRTRRSVPKLMGASSVPLTDIEDGDAIESIE